MFEPGETDRLIEEIDRYLAAVDLFRALECEPTWRLEPSPPSVLLEQFLSDRREHRAVH